MFGQQNNYKPETTRFSPGNSERQAGIFNSEETDHPLNLLSTRVINKNRLVAYSINEYRPN